MLWALCTPIISSSVSAQVETNSETLSLRFSVGYVPLRSYAPPERTWAKRFAIQAFFLGPVNSKILVEAIYSDWSVGEPFKGQVGWVEPVLPHSPPDWTDGKMIGVSLGVRITEYALSKSTLTPIAAVRLAHHLEKWYYNRGPVGYWPHDHSELQIAGELRFQLRMSNSIKAPLLEISGQWISTLRNLDDFESVVEAEWYQLSILFPILIISD